MIFALNLIPCFLFPQVLNIENTNGLTLDDQNLLSELLVGLGGNPEIAIKQEEKEDPGVAALPGW